MGLRVGVGGDRQAGVAMDAGHRPQDALDARGEAGLVGAALEHSGTDARTRDPVLYVVEEELLRASTPRGRSPASR